MSDLTLSIVDPRFTDRAWSDGAYQLAEACAASGGEIEGPQLKMLLSRGERTLIRMVEDEKTVGWGVIRIDPLPNMRVLFITDLVARNTGFKRLRMYFEEVKKMSRSLGCSRVRWAGKPAQERLYRIVCGCKPVYTIMEVEL